MQIRPPVLQLALDYAKVSDAIDMAKSASKPASTGSRPARH
jgi:3-keto-L-gulonate-6-phosphate decarboxylase